MKDKKTEKTISKLAFEKYRNSFNTIMLPLSFFALICIVSIILEFIAPSSAFLTVPFLAIPALFALSAVNSISNQTNGREGIGFFVMWRTYFSGFFRGGYRVITGFFKSLLVYLVTSIVVSTILIYAIMTKDVGYTEFLNSLSTVATIDDALNSMVVFIETNQTFKLITFIADTLAFTCGAIMFVHHISINGVKYYHNFLTATPIPASDLNVIHKETMKKMRKPFYKDYYKSEWFLLVLVFVSLLGFSAVSYFFIPNFNNIHGIVFAVFATFVICLFFLPYHLNVLQLLYKKYKNQYISTFVKLSFESLEEIKKTQEIDPEKEKEIRAFLSKQEEDINNKEDEKKD